MYSTNKRINFLWNAATDDRNDYRCIVGTYPCRDCLLFTPRGALGVPAASPEDTIWDLWIVDTEASDYIQVSLKEAKNWLFEQGKSACWYT